MTNLLNKNVVSGKPKTIETIISMVPLLIFWIILSLPHDIFSPKGLNSIFQHIITGIPLSWLVVRLMKRPLISRTQIKAHRLANIFRLIVYIFYLIGPIIMGGIDVAVRVLRFNINISPGVIKFRSSLSDDWHITLNANSITLTPGTITLDVEKDDKGSIFWVHCISQEAIENIKHKKGFENKISNIYRRQNVC